ncbi:MAG: ABC transporter substrate-binding protein [Halobacteriales archaeon]
MSRISRRAFLRASGGATTFGVLAGCTGDGGGDTPTETHGDHTHTDTPSPSPAGPIVIGGLEPISGPFAPWAGVHQAGLQFAIDEINANGGVLGGRELKLTVTDTGADPAQADSSFRRLVEQEGVVATTGAVSSDVGIRVSQTAQDLKVPHLLHMAGSNKVITPNTRHTFRVGLVPSVTYIQAQASAFEDRYDNIGAIIADYAWGRAVESAINNAFSKDVNIQVAPIGASDFRSYLRQFDEGLEMLIASGHPPGSVAIANQAFELGVSPDVVTGASTPPQLLAGALNDEARAGYTHIHNSDPFGQKFKDVAGRFAEGHDSQFNTHTAYGYVTGKLIAAAIEDAGEASPGAITDGLKNIELDTLFANPVKYSDHGELDETIVIYSKLLATAPRYDPQGSYSYREVGRSQPLPALAAGK